jgi:hypothetical protein
MNLNHNSNIKEDILNKSFIFDYDIPINSSFISNIDNNSNISFIKSNKNLEDSNSI